MLGQSDSRYEPRVIGDAGIDTTVHAAVIQDAPVAFDRECTLRKVGALAAAAASRGARLVVLPEAFVSGCPRGLGFAACLGSGTAQGRKLFRRYWGSSVDVPGPATEALAAVAREARAYLDIGGVERDGGMLYCSANEIAPGRFDFGVVGHYARLDILRLTANTSSAQAVDRAPRQERNGAKLRFVILGRRGSVQAAVGTGAAGSPASRDSAKPFRRVESGIKATEHERSRG